MRPIFIALFAGLLLSLLPLDALAQCKSQVPSAQRNKAKRLYAQGKLAHSRAEYEDAIVKFDEAYELCDAPGILKAIGNTYEKLGDVRRAREYLGRFREVAPASDRRKIDKKLENLDARIAELDEQERKEAEKREAEKREAAAAEAERRKQDLEVERQRQADREEQEQQDDHGSRIAVSWAVTGVGLAAVLAGVIVDVAAGASRPDQDAACLEQGGQTLCRADQRDDIESSDDMAVAGDITWIAGSAVTAAGVVMLVAWAYAEEEEGEVTTNPPAETAEPTAVVAPMVSPSTAGVALIGRF